MKTKTQQTLEQMLFARLKKTGGKYRARTSIDGARTRLTIEANSKHNAATAAANAITERAAARKNPKLADILAVYKTLAAANNSGASLKPATAHKNAQSLALILRAAKLDPLTITLSELSPAAVETWRRYCYQKAGLQWDIPNPDKNTSLNSTWRQAKSVFSRRALEAYARAGYTIPQNAIDFAETPELTPTKKLGFSPIDEETDATLKRLSALALDGKRGQGIPAPDVAAMYQMARFAGMTLNEIKHFRPSWINRVQTEQPHAVPPRRVGEHLDYVVDSRHTHTVVEQEILLQKIERVLAQTRNRVSLLRKVVLATRSLTPERIKRLVYRHFKRRDARPLAAVHTEVKEQIVQPFRLPVPRIPRHHRKLAVADFEPFAKAPRQLAPDVSLLAVEPVPKLLLVVGRTL